MHMKFRTIYTFLKKYIKFDSGTNVNFENVLRTLYTFDEQHYTSGCSMYFDFLPSNLTYIFC